jgi:hypothetical protein
MGVVLLELNIETQVGKTPSDSQDFRISLPIRR